MEAGDQCRERRGKRALRLPSGGERRVLLSSNAANEGVGVLDGADGLTIGGDPRETGAEILEDERSSGEVLVAPAVDRAPHPLPMCAPVAAQPFDLGRGERPP